MKINQKISLIIPAYNEEKNIGRVLDVVVKLDFIDQIIVVDDASSDNTLKILNKYDNLQIIRHQNNQGKGGAIVSGMKKAEHDLLLFLDADLVGLKAEHLLELLSPIIFTKKADLVLGVFDLSKLKATNLANRIVPAISGQKAIWKKSMPRISELKNSKYGVDIIIFQNVPKRRREVVLLERLSQITKENKERDFLKATKKRVNMYLDIYKSFSSLEKAKKELKDKIDKNK